MLLDDTQPGIIDEGRAMAEIIYDEAPGITDIYFSTGTISAAGKAASINNLVAAGVKVIADDIFYLDEPMFQDGQVAQAVDAAKAAGVNYFASAGNRARQSWEGTYTGTTDNDFDTSGAVDTVQTLGTFTNRSPFISLQWAEPWGAATTNLALDFYVDGVLVPGQTDDNNITSGIPNEFEGITINGTHTLGIGIRRVAGAGTPFMKYIVGGVPSGTTFAEHATNSNAINPDAASAAGSLAVAASNWATPTTPEPYSSRGPSITRLFTAAGVPTAPVVRPKPALDAADGVVYDRARPCSRSPAPAPSTPSAAGIATLIRSAAPSLTESQVRTLMTDPTKAQACATATPAADCGSGFIMADLMVQSLDASPPTVSGALSPARTERGQRLVHLGLRGLDGRRPADGGLVPDRLHIRGGHGRGSADPHLHGQEHRGHQRGLRDVQAGPDRADQCDRDRAHSETDGLGAVHALAQQQCGEEHRERRVERDHDRGHGQVAAPAGDHEQPGRQCSEHAAAQAQRRAALARQPRLPQCDGDGDDDHAAGGLVDGQGSSPASSETRERPRRGAEAEPRKYAVQEPGRRRRPGRRRLAGHEPDRRERQRDAEPDDQPGPFPDQDARHHRHERRADAGDRRHHSHPAGGQAPVEERGAEPVAETRQQSPGQVGAGRACVGRECDRQGGQDAAALRDQGNRPGADPLRHPAAVEVGQPVRRRGQQRQQHRHVRTTPAIQTKVATTAAASSIRMLSPTALSECLVDGQAAFAPRRRYSAR